MPLELNPDERLHADMKHAIGAKTPVRTKSKLKAAVEDHMTMIGTSPERVRACRWGKPISNASR